ncbi:cytochrome b/b6 domain-containing protein [Sulfurovum sp. ST-21]|uniref:Cytochrome b/b6 domain-containing protein n=1 Tax=Sulfurovum indicum TaxID=2779528 RepID=A0A7M1S3C0_9BACT|nr:cytochrome b/b6 domain-containing protein [Sulfurovum indicum]QOR61917.1 cytochrome b/b6 domain-containing protein [Sulfurovum indicum]
MNKKPGYVFVWPIGTRIIHWMMALSFTAAFITSFHKNQLHSHVAFGFIFLIILVYRIIWGIVGPRYATFKTFKLRLSELKGYFVEKVRNRWRKIPAGHNPASSWFTVWALIVGTVIVISGLLLYGVEEAKGCFRFLNEDYYQYMDTLTMLHKYASYLFATWVIIHITGVLIEQFWHRTGMAFAMITGYKKTEGEDTKVKRSLSIFAYLMILLAIVTYFFIVSSNYNYLTLQKYTNVDYEEEHPDYYHECGECHVAYPPYLLPRRSWERIMGALDNHFGEEITEANITKLQQASILEYLIQHAAETSKREAAVKTMKSLGERRPKAITKTPYWRETHKHIPKYVYRQKKIKDKSNCAACHRDFKYGNLEDMNILYDF